MESKITRDEQIQQAEIKYSNDTLFDGCDYIGQVAKQEAFIAGAKWADKHPKPELVNKEEFIEEIRNWLKNNTDWNKAYINDEVAFSGWCRPVCNPNYGKIDELVKYLEE